VPDTGRTQLLVTDPRSPRLTRKVATDHRPGSESLHPTDPRNFDLGAAQILYVTESRGRDLLVRRQLKHVVKERKAPKIDPDEGPDLGLSIDPEPELTVRIKKKRRERLRLRQHGVMAVGSVALSPDGEDAVFIGMDEASVRHLYLWTDAGVRKLTDDLYSERDVTWGPGGIVYASDATEDGRYHLFHLPDLDAEPVQLTGGEATDRSPSWIDEDRVAWSRIVDGRAEVGVLELGGEALTTDLSTGAFDPAPGPGEELWALVHHGGRKRPARLDDTVFTDAPSLAEGIGSGPPRTLPSRPLEGASRYNPLAPTNWGLDGGFGLFGYSVGGLYGSLYLSASDQLRDHGLILQVSSFGSLELTNAQLLYLNQQGRLTLGGGPFHVWRYRIDQSIPGLTLLTGERFYGGMVSVRLPLDRFVYVQLDEAIGGAVSFLFPGDEVLIAPGDLLDWEDRYTTHRFTSESTLRLGIDTTEFHPKTGPVAGSSLLLEGTLGWIPLLEQAYTQARLDAAHYFALPLVSGANLGFEASTGTSGAGDFQRSFWLLSYDTLRAYTLFDPALAGRHFWVTSAELQIPLDAIVRLAIASSVEGVAALDFGAVSDEYPGLWDNRVLDGVLGTNFVLGPFELRLHFAHAIDIGAPLPVTPRPWVTNFSLAWLGGGLFGF
jgi:hypothetical protein